MRVLILILILTTAVHAGQYPVIHVVDGDTIDILFQGKKERVRMLCVDTPESVHPDRSRNTPLGAEASTYTKSRLAGEFVDLEFESKRRGKYGRLLAYVIVDGQNFNLELVREGWSPYYTKYGESEKHHAEFVAAEDYARTSGIRVWVPKTLNLGNEDLQCKMVMGNVKSMVFHQPSCKYFNCKNCTRAFPGRHEAIKAGYKPCGICTP
tara:strand:- start:2483 stop:3109 length:627 start_codon:yes stop_codon:yes gene_type:complete